jgi:P-type Ca2+ transporter type 2C
MRFFAPQDPLIKILMVALVITLALAFMGYAEWVEGVGIAVAVFLATFVATYSEYKNESSFQKLQAEASKVKNNVFREGDISSIFVGEVVKGDYILLQPGDKIPADGIVVDGELVVNQASLTGESRPVHKSKASAGYKIKESENASFGDKFLVFREAVVVDGEAVMIADRVGVASEYGKISLELGEKETRPSPLQIKLERLADNISTLGYIGAILIGLSFLFKQFVVDQGYDMTKMISYMTNWQLALKDSVTALILGIIIIVVAVPEGLPMMIAIVLSLNMRKLLKAKVLVRKLLGIEAAGSLNILFSDKTGTITKGQLETHMFIACSLKRFHSFGEIPSSLQGLLQFCIEHSTSSHVRQDGAIVGGNASERAFLAWLGGSKGVARDAVSIKREIQFTSERKFSAAEVVVGASSAMPRAETTKEKTVVIVKGAPEKLLGNCTHYYDDADGSVKPFKNHDKLDEAISTLSEKGMRMIAFATSPVSLQPEAKNGPAVPEKLTFIGVVALKDEIRPESKDAIRLMKQAGIQVVMITGDRVETAVSIAKEIDLVPSRSGGDELSKSSDKLSTHVKSVITSDELHKMSDDEVSAILPQLRVVARALPTDKSRLVRIAQSSTNGSQSLVVGMTGDGVNDAAALKKADVGFAMGSGTEVAKEASDLVIMDDNFYSIAQSVLYGRTIFRSIRKFIVFQSAINVASTLIVFLGPFLGFDMPLTLIQLLWVNLVMDTLAALAFGGEPALQSYMADKPVSRTEAIISPDMWSSILSGGCFIAALCIAFLTNDHIEEFFTRAGQTAASDNNPVFLTAFFCLFIFTATINAFNVRTPKINIFDHITGNVGFIFVIAFIWLVQVAFSFIGGSILRTVPLEPHEWGAIMKGSLLIIPFDMLRKIIVAPFLPKQLEDNSEFENPKAEDDEDGTDESESEEEEEPEPPKQETRKRGAAKKAAAAPTEEEPKEAKKSSAKSKPKKA